MPNRGRTLSGVTTPTTASEDWTPFAVHPAWVPASASQMTQVLLPQRDRAELDATTHRIVRSDAVTGSHLAPSR